MLPADIHAAFKSLQGKARAFISFEPGEYKLGKPLVLSNAGHVEIRGHRAWLGDSQSDRVLVVRDCDSLVLEGLTLVGDAFGKVGRDTFLAALSNAGLEDDTDGDTLAGALTVQDTPQVRLLDVQAEVAADEGFNAAGIAVLDFVSVKAKRGAARMHVDIGHCQVTVGAQQAGIVCANALRANVHDNVLSDADEDRPMRQGIAVVGADLGEVRVERNLVAGGFAGVGVATAFSGATKASTQKVDRVSVEHNTIRLNLQGAEPADGFGVAIGSADNARVSHNDITAEVKFGREIGLKAIRIQGTFGTQVMVQDNHFVGAETCVALLPTKQPTRQLLWLVAGNVGEDVGKLMDPQAAAQGAITQRDNIAS